MTWQNFGNNTVTLGVIALLCLFTSGAAIVCYECDSNDQPYCSESWDHDVVPHNVEPRNCNYLPGARYCVKATGHNGTSRFCSARDLGHSCNYTTGPGDERAYKTCFYTCYDAACNGTPYGVMVSTSPLILSVILSVLSLVPAR
ncbi:UPAR/Ly6 domain-containing protein bou-like [Ornithodoros turicata]|uniref:UPAR/Ly6 domain-containing protein bou-like n=1 Tax=Ornithodoros turicata TaxID=34597 RepID=UPI00313A1E0C